MSVHHLAADLAAVTGMTSGRIGPTLTALVGLSAVVIGVLALRRAGRREAVAALLCGVLGTVAGGVFAATADGGPGTGNGIVAAFAAVVLGAAAIVLGGLSLRRA